MWLTADWHLGHKNIISHCDRPFTSVDEMDQTIINNFKAMVGQEDIVYFLGDFAWRQALVKEILPDLPGKWIFILGNHDEPFKNRIAENVIQVERLLITKLLGYSVTLCHYPMASWHKSHYHAYHFHAHCHGTLQPVWRRRIDVGVDCWNFHPVHMDQLFNA